MTKITKFRKVDRGALVGYCNVEFERNGVEIRDISVFEKEGRHWVGFPSRQYEDSHGEKKYAPYVKINNKDFFEKFQKSVLQGLKAGGHIR